MKVTLDAALRARDVSRPAPGQEALAERALPERLASHRSGAEPQPAAGGQLPDGPGHRPGPAPGPPRPRRPSRPATRRDDRAGAADAPPPAERADYERQDGGARVRRRSRFSPRPGQGSADQGRGGSSPDFS